MLKLIDDYPEESIRSGALGPLRASAKALDKLSIPTRYPNGLPDLTPFEVYTDAEAQAAIAAAGGVVAACERLLPAGRADAPKE